MLPSVGSALPKSGALIAATADELTDSIDRNKPPMQKPYLETSSYWDEWLAKQRGKNGTSDAEDLLSKLLQGRGDRPDLGAGVKRMDEAMADGASSAGGSGAALTVSNLGSINKERNVRRC